MIDADALQLRLDRGDYRRVVESLAKVELGSAISLLTTYAGRATDLRPWLEGAEINRDRNLRLQYLAGLGLNCYEADWIYKSISTNRRYPTDIFPANGDRGRALQLALQSNNGP